MVFKNEMWIRRPCLCATHGGVGVVNAARMVGVVNAARIHRRGLIYRAHAPAPFMGEGSPFLNRIIAPR
jgi:hypothetical protein